MSSAPLSLPVQEIQTQVQRWERRGQRLRLLLWLPRAVMLGALLGAMLALLLRFGGAGAQVSLFGAGAVLGAVLLVAVGRAFWPRPLLGLAREYEQRFGLQERLSTALELQSGRISAPAELSTQQMHDAAEHARRLDPAQKLPLKIRPLEWLGAFAALVLLGLLLALLAGSDPGALAGRGDPVALAGAAEELRDIVEAVANETTLSAEERSALLETLERSLNDLERGDLSAEEAFAAMGDAQQALREQAEQLRQQGRSQDQAFGAAADTLRRETIEIDAGSAPTEGGSGIAEFQELAQQLSEAMQSLSPSQREAMQRAMEMAADEAMQANPQLSQALRDAAENMRQGDDAAAREALQRALEQAGDAGERQALRDVTARTLEQNADAAAEAAEQIANSDSSRQPESGDEASEEDPPGGATSQQAAQGEEGQQGGQGEDGAPGEEGPSGEQGGTQSGEGSGEGEAAAFSEEASQGGQGEDANQGSMQGAAGDAANTGQDSSGAAEAPSSSDNNPDGQGEQVYEAIYAPQRLSAEGTTDIVLEPDTSDVPVVQGDFQQNPLGESVVPYNRVFRAYAEAANRALNSDAVPLTMRDVVREYFNSLEPASR